MSFSYSGDPASSDLDQVRFLIGDTDLKTNWQLLQDEEILFVLSQQPSAEPRPSKEVLRASAICSDAIAATFSRLVNTKNLSLSVNASDRAEQYYALARRLWARAGEIVTEDGRRAVVSGMFAGGLTISGKRTLDRNTDDVQPAFKRGQDDHPEALPDAGSVFDLLGDPQ